MIAVFNRLPVREGTADEMVERFASGGGAVQGFPGFVSMEVLVSEGTPEGEDEVLVITRWESREAFDAWVGSEEFKEAHRSARDSAQLMRGRPQMSSYAVAVEREPGG